MVNVSVSRRYARALFELCSANSDKVLDQLATLVKALTQNAELLDLAANPAYTRAQRISTIEAVMAKVEGLDESVGNLVRLLIERGRLGYLGEIARQFRDQADLKAGRVRGKVTSAKALSPDELKRIERQLELATQRNVVLECKVDASLLGGVSAQVGSVVYDGSLRTQLDELKRELQAH
jgi:F-type H+-transporting ATPase subunit delta